LSRAAVQNDSRRDCAVIALLAALSLWIPFANYGFHGELIGGDAAAIMALPVQSLHQLLGVYLPGPGFGLNGSVGIQQLFPLLLLMTALVKLGIPASIATRLFIALLFFISMSGAYAVARLLIGRRAPRYAVFASTIAALFYGCNNFTVVAYSSAQSTFTMSYAVLPWIFFGVTYGIERALARGVAITAAGIAFAGGATNQAQFVVACLVVIIGLLVELADGADAKRAFLVSASGLGLGIVCCLWWILPIPTVIHAGLGALAAQDVHSWLQWMSARSSFAELFKLGGYTGEASLPYARWYLGAAGTILGFVPIVSAIITFGRLRTRMSVTLLVCFLLSAALAKGVHPPFGNAYAYVTDHVPVFSIFRSAYDKWIGIEALTLSCLIALALAALGSDVANRPRRATALGLSCVLAGSVILLPWTLLAGVALAHQSRSIGFISQIPKSYDLVASYINRSASNGRTVILDSGSLPYPLYNWHYFGEDPLLRLLEKPISPLEALREEAQRLPPARLAYMLQSLGVKFVVVHRDVLNPVSAPNMNSLVQGHYAFRVLSLPELTLYEMRATPIPPISVVHFPVVLGVRQASHDLVVGSPTSAANAQFAITDRQRPITLLGFSQIAGAGRLDQLKTENMNARIGLRVPPNAHLFFIPNDTGTAVWLPASCGTSSCVRLHSPTAWRVEGTALPSYDEIVRFSSTERRGITYDGTPIAQRRTQFSILGVHRLALNHVVRVTSLALIRRNGNLLFLPERNHVGSRIDVIVGRNTLMIVPNDLGALAPVRLAMVDTDDHELASATITRRTVSVVLPLPDWTPTHNKLLLELQSGTSRIRVVTNLIAPTIVQAGTDAPTVSLPYAAGGVALHRVSQLVLETPGENAVFGLRPKDLQWSTNLSAGKMSNEVDLTSDRRAWALASGILLASDAYMVRLRYRTVGHARVTAWLDGSYAQAALQLIADGRWHVLNIRLYPPPLSNGFFQIIVELHAGTTLLKPIEITDVGADGTFISLAPGRAFPGWVVSQKRIAPWHFRAQVANCTNCWIALQTADVLNWRVRGASVVRSLQGLGGISASGMSSGGESIWQLRTQRPIANLDFIYEPAVLFHRGIWISIAGFVVMALCALRGRRAGEQIDALHEALAFSTLPFSWALAALGMLTALVTGLGWLNASDILGSTLWLTLFGSSVAAWFGPRTSGSVA
jgi:hypothetical protein